MAGSGEIFKGDDGTFGFRVKSSGGTVVATDGGPPGHKTKGQARTVLNRLLKGDYNGPVDEIPSITCGMEITADTKLDGDLHCTKGPALIVTANNITLDLGGHTITGDGHNSASAPGILLKGVTGVTVQKGTIEHFGAGVSIEGGGSNTVQNVTVQDNVGDPAGDYGDGITVVGSSGNTIQGNTVRRNGPFSGISLVGASTKNTVSTNVVTNNNMLPGKASGGRQDFGIRIEGPGADDNTVTGNTVTGSGADGIVVLPTCKDPSSSCAGVPNNSGNVISKNMSHGNGTSGDGSGVRLFAVAQPIAASKTTVTDNIANSNKTYGVCIDAAGPLTPDPTGNVLTGNSGTGNGVFDGFDGNSTCGTNTWNQNTFGTVNQPCVSAPKSAASVAAPVAPEVDGTALVGSDDFPRRGSD